MYFAASEMAKRVIELNKDGYPELEDKQTMILQVLKNEEEQFNKTIDAGLNILNDMIAELEKSGEKILKGTDAFKL